MPMLRIVSWNIARRDDAWRHLMTLGPDIALLQEATPPPDDVEQSCSVSPGEWRIAGAGVDRPWRSVVAVLNPNLPVEWIPANDIAAAPDGELPVSRLGSLNAAVVTTKTSVEITLVSMYAVWERPLSALRSGWIYADASVHRLISDVSALVGSQSLHHVIAAGDLNVLHGYGEGGSLYWGRRYQTVFDRFEAIGLPFAGPQFPNGRQVEPWPDELPAGSDDVPTYYTAQQKPAGATRQLDFVFASQRLHSRLTMKALNGVDEWGPSDHCPVVIDISED